MCDGTDVEIGLRCPDYAHRVLDAATVLLDAQRNELYAATVIYDRTTPADMDAALAFSRYREAIENVLIAERIWIASAAQYAATTKGAKDLRRRFILIESNAQKAWNTGDKIAGRALFEEAALYDQALKRGDVLRFAAQEAYRRLGSVPMNHDCTRDAVILPRPVMDHGLLPLIGILAPDSTLALDSGQ